MDSNQKRRLIERGIVRALIGYLRRKGWDVFRTYDGMDYEYPATDDAAIAACFNLDEVSLRFVPHAVRAKVDAVRGSGDCAAVRAAGDVGKQAEHGVLLVMGNGEDIVSDWEYSVGDPDGFYAAMEAFFAKGADRAAMLPDWLREGDIKELGRRSATDTDRIAILAGSWLRDGDALAVLFKGRDGLRRIGEVLPGSLTEKHALRKADFMLLKAGLSAERVSLVEVDAYPGGWRKRAIVAYA